MNLRLAVIADINGILALQQKYLVAVIPENNRAGGFVTTPFSIEQIKTVIEFSGLFVAELNTQIVGYAFACTWDFFSQWPIFPYMTSRFPGLNFNGAKITASTTFQYGPICIDESHRGTGLLQKLFECMRINMQLKYPVGVTFINKINKRSYDAHTKKLNLVAIDEFEFNNNSYYGLAFSTAHSVLI